MGRPPKDTTATALLSAYEAAQELGGSDAPLSAEAKRMNLGFQQRTGAFRPEDPWFEARSRAFWDDALATQGFAALAAEQLDDEARAFVAGFARGHRGLFEIHHDGPRKRFVDVWSGAELLVAVLDEAQAVALEHAEGLVDARVVAADEEGLLFALPGAFHHPPDATEPLAKVLDAARARKMRSGDVLDALMRMELVLKSSSRVKTGFAYRPEALDAPRADAPRAGRKA